MELNGYGCARAAAAAAAVASPLAAVARGRHRRAIQPGSKHVYNARDVPAEIFLRHARVRVVYILASDQQLVSRPVIPVPSM